jgi:integrase
MEHLKRAGPGYHPVDLEELTPETFLSYLISLTDSKNSEFMKSYGGLRSALTQLFTQCEVAPSKAFLQKMKQVMTGLKNTSAKARGTKGTKLGVGKEPLPFEVYRAICTWLLEDGGTDCIFAHCFLIMTWNLMCRSRNTVNIRLEHIGWENDSMTVQFAHTKTDKVGKLAKFKRHIFANPAMPEICAVHAFGRFRLAFSGKNEGYLFEGAAQYDRFRKLLQRVVQEHSIEIIAMGVDPKNLGVHSIRKGAATYCSNGTTAGVSFSAVCVRAGWSIGGTVDRYIHHESAGDQVCGRTVAGLDVASFHFAASPPHFPIVGKSEEGSDTEEAATLLVCTEEDVAKSITAAFGSVPTLWLMFCRFALASLLFHREWMRKRLHKDSGLYNALIFRRHTIFDRAVSSTMICYPWNNDCKSGTIPALEDMAALFATEPVQVLLSSVRTKTGRVSRVRQNAWDTVGKALRKVTTSSAKSSTKSKLSSLSTGGATSRLKRKFLSNRRLF